MFIIPAIDIIDGKCVRLEQGQYDRKQVYHDDPLEMAKMFEDHGIERLHLVDLDGAKASHVVNWKVLERIASNTSLRIDFGGGIKSQKDLEIVFNSGAKQATGGSIAAEKPELFFDWLDQFGAEKLILGADLKDGFVATRGWLHTTDKSWSGFLEGFVDKGVKYVICTDISKDGMLQGPSITLYKEMMEQYPEMQLIASGGVSSMEDLEELREIGCYGAIVGKAIYEKNISLADLKTFNYAG